MAGNFSDTSAIITWTFQCTATCYVTNTDGTVIATIANALPITATGSAISTIYSAQPTYVTSSAAVKASDLQHALSNAGVGTGTYFYCESLDNIKISVTFYDGNTLNMVTQPTTSANVLSWNIQTT